MNKAVAFSPFAAHLMRGVAGMGAIVAAIMIGQSDSGWASTALSLALGVLALVLFRGCPVCWLYGLFMTLRNY